MNIKVKLDKGAYMPERAHPTDAGADIRAVTKTIIPARGSAIFHTGVHIALPENYGGFLMSKSGLNTNHDITSEGVIDVGYTGEIVAKLYNNGDKDYTVYAGDKITQLVIMPVSCAGFDEVNELEATERGDNGFGSTGR